jgi:hypothetical protein
MKSLVILAGPHQSESDSVEEFFRKHATGLKSSSTDNGLDGWTWPQIDADLPGEKHQYFEHLFWKNRNETVEEILMSSIEDAWINSKHGIIIGANGFDNTRGDPNSLGLKTLTKITNRLQVAPHQVSIAIMYRSPRVDQWVALYHGNDEDTYHDFVCNHEYTEHLLSIPMNPMMLASVYHHQGYHVAAIDLAGVRKMNLDPAHTVACEVLPNTECNHGWVVDIERDINTAQLGHSSDFSVLSTTEEQELEKIFRDRDCHYKENLKGANRFSVIHQDVIWEGCSPTEHDRYHDLQNDTYVFEQVKAQKGCDASHTPEDLSILQDDAERGTQKVVPFLAILFASTFVIFWIIGCHKRRRTKAIVSPRSHSVWIDFADEAFQVEPNLRSASSEEDDSLIDVDLISPKSVFGGVVTKSKSPNMIDGIREGRSVRSVYRVGLTQPSQSNNSISKRRESFESSIKTLEKELA